MKTRRIGAAITAGVLAVSVTAPVQAMNDMVKPTTNLTVTAAAENTIRVTSKKGNTLKTGDRSLLMIGPYGDEYTAKSDAPGVVDVEQVLGFWVAVAKADGKAAITVTNKSGASATTEITVGTGAAALTVENGNAPADRNAALDDNQEIRQEMIRLINEHRKEHGLAELPVNNSIMDAAQDVSATRPIGHSTYEFESLAAHGWPHGAGVNLTRFNGLDRIDSIAEHAVENWMNSTYHRQTLLDGRATCIGVGVTVYRGTVYAVMMAGDPNSVSPI